MGLGNLPVASGSEHVRALERLDWAVVRRANGKHFLLQKAGNRHHISIPDQREVKRALLATVLKTAGITEEQYLRAFGRK